MEGSLSFLIFYTWVEMDSDNTVLFCKVNSEQLMYLGWTLMWFEAFSGLKINLSKSEIIPVGGVDNVELLASELGCGVGSFPHYVLGPSPWGSSQGDGGLGFH